MVKDKTVTLQHGNGGKKMHEVIEVFRSKLTNPTLDEMADAAQLEVTSGKIAFSTDSFVIKPVFFPGGDIGELAVYGTVNDISMKGAKPLFISLALIIEEGFSLSSLEKIASSVKKAARASGVKVVTGDIKVVEKGAADGIFINTSGIGVVEKGGYFTGAKARAGDTVVINGPIAEHGIAIVNAREDLGFTGDIKSDCRNLNHSVEKCLKASRNISVLRDPTRGGLATTLNEIADNSNLGIDINETDVPVRQNVRKLCDVLGFDPLYVANEGKFVCFVREKDSEKVRKAMGPGSRIIGRVTKAHKKKVHLITQLGSTRILPMLEVSQLPRIC
ncbi:MAG: hydrogenase expression/formation protein HypE [Candidatus Omnitrophica bacterium]|nr:hydrogenase expression/formation protein HypE [Candidatus Omnitrophota bacterium]